MSDQLASMIDAAEGEAKKHSPEQAKALFIEMLNRNNQDGVSPGSLPGVGELPPIKRPASFRSQPEVRSTNRNLLHSVNELMNMAPELAGQIKSIQAGPTFGVIDSMIQSGISPLDFEDTNLLGQTGLLSGDIYINPRIMNPIYDWSDTMRRTVAHEFSHAAGADEANARLTEALYGRAMEAEPIMGKGMIWHHGAPTER